MCTCSILVPSASLCLSTYLILLIKVIYMCPLYHTPLAHVDQTVFSLVLLSLCLGTQRVDGQYVFFWIKLSRLEIICFIFVGEVTGEKLGIILGKRNWKVRWLIMLMHFQALPIAACLCYLNYHNPYNWLLSCAPAPWRWWQKSGSELSEACQDT